MSVQVKDGSAELAEDFVSLALRPGTGLQAADEFDHVLAFLSQLAQ
jgi:hypothetical protein